VIEAVHLGDVTCVAASIEAAFRRGYGVKRLADFMQDAVQTNRVHYSVETLEAAIVCYRLAGPQTMFVLHCKGFFPHEQQMARMARAFKFAIGDVPSLQGVLDAWAKLPPCRNYKPHG